jgi:hypothetical protein
MADAPSAEPLAATEHPADREAIARAFAVVPTLTRIEAAGSAVGLPDTTLLHAGPAFRSIAEICLPILNSACLTAVLVGLADTFDEAEEQIKAGEITLEPAQDRHVVTPLATVVGSLTPLHVVEDAAGSGATAYAPINDGALLPTRVGQRNEAVFQQLRWMSVAVPDRFDAALREPMPLLPLALHGLANGDDCHGRTNAASAALVAELDARLPFGIGNAATEFLRSSPSLFLNLWMAACKCIMLGGSGVAGSSLITGAGGNGVEFAIQVSAFPGRWFAAPATSPIGELGEAMHGRALAAIGDSAVVDALGLGAMAFNYAPAQRDALGRFMPATQSVRVERLLAAPHPAFASLGLKLMTTARRVDRLGDGPTVALGILDREGVAGRIGGGIYTMPTAPFRDALSALSA